MNKFDLDKLNEEIIYLGLVYLLSLIAFFISFYRSDFLWSLKMVSAVFYLFVIPGYFFAFLFTPFNFLEKLVLGSLVGYILVTIMTYYANILFDITLKSANIMPLIIMAISFLIFFIIEKYKGKKAIKSR